MANINNKMQPLSPSRNNRDVPKGGNAEDYVLRKIEVKQPLKNMI
jgi:hypothetical protein